ncbi:uncharacterized protein LOC143465445 isoform X2 [Clavelina lepadiformis]|uniref:uncharacterized protein LOC143465445 isoform X2 n=1 Tax=Clavelina lepadiformis TaxID=159417 RepID=UPI0040430A06
MGKLKGTTTKAKFRYWVKEPKKRKRPVSLFCKPFGPALKPNANSHIVTGGSMGGDLTATSPKIRSTSNVTSSFGAFVCFSHKSDKCALLCTKKMSPNPIKNQLYNSHWNHCFSQTI